MSFLIYGFIVQLISIILNVFDWNRLEMENKTEISSTDRYREVQIVQIATHSSS